jgi:hypothetical protein
MASGDRLPIQVALVSLVESLSPSLQDVRDALQIQLRRDFAPVWGIDAEVTSYPAGALSVPAGSWMLHIVDDEKALSRLEPQRDPDGIPLPGLHLETPAGAPQAHVLLDRPDGEGQQGAASLSDGQTWSIVASHELLEMLVNPHCNRTAWRQSDRDSGEIEFFALEIADPCESRGFEYSIHLDKQSVNTAAAADGVDIEVSDFVYPSWFWRLGKPPYHHNHGANLDSRIDAPFQIGRHSSVAVFTRGRGWFRRDSQGGDADLPVRRGDQLTLSDCPDWIGTDWIGT